MRLDTQPDDLLKGDLRKGSDTGIQSREQQIPINRPTLCGMELLYMI